MFCPDWVVYIEYTFGRRAEETKHVFFEFRKTRHFVEKWHQCIPKVFSPLHFSENPGEEIWLLC